MPANATLIQHLPETSTRKTYSVDLEAVRSAPCPEPEGDWYPIPHSALIDAVEQACDQRGLQITGRAYALNRTRTQMISTLLLGGEQAIAPDFQLAMGLRNSTDKTMVAGLCSGAYVFVCDNSSFSSEVNLSRKHTKFIMRDLPRLVSAAVDGFMTKAIDQARTFAHWKTVDIDLDRATLLAVDAAEHGTMPGSGILAVRKEFLAPRHAEFLPEGRHTVWGLYNAFTQFLSHDREAVSPVRAQRDFLRVHRTLAEAFPVPAVVAASVN